MLPMARWIGLIAWWCLATSIATAQNDAAGNWPQWRGPQGNGISSATDLPLTWSADEQVIWKTPLPHWSGATPVLFGDRLYLTSPSTPDPAEVQRKREEAQQRGGRRRGFGGGGRHAGGQELLLLCVAKEDGAILWQKQQGRCQEPSAVSSVRTSGAPVDLINSIESVSMATASAKACFSSTATTT